MVIIMYLNYFLIIVASIEFIIALFLAFKFKLKKIIYLGVPLNFTREIIEDYYKRIHRQLSYLKGQTEKEQDNTEKLKLMNKLSDLQNKVTYTESLLKSTEIKLYYK